MWAAAPGAGDDIAALAIQVGSSCAHHATYPGGSPALETAGAWLAVIDGQESRVPPVGIARRVARLPALFMRLPLGAFDINATGAEVGWFRSALASPRRDDPWWVARDHAPGVAQVAAPVQLVGGWYDIFLPSMLEDYAARQAAGLETQLIIGPWAHTSPGLIADAMREALAWLRAHLLDDCRPCARTPVRSSPASSSATAGGRSGCAAGHRRAAAVGRRRRPAAGRSSRPTTAAMATATTRPIRPPRSAGRTCSHGCRSSTTARSSCATTC